MRRSIRARRGNPILSGLRESVSSPLPGQHAFFTFRNPVIRHVRTGRFRFFGLGRRFLGRHNPRIIELQISFRPLLDPFQRRYQVLKRIGDAEPQISFSVFAERGAR